MKKFAKLTRFSIQTAIALAVLMAPAAWHARACPMCYQNAAASGPRTVSALNHGVLILMFPPALITVGIFCVGFKRRNTYRPSGTE